jgi:hypothetical protein
MFNFFRIGLVEGGRRLTVIKNKENIKNCYRYGNSSPGIPCMCVYMHFSTGTGNPNMVSVVVVRGAVRHYEHSALRQVIFGYANKR